MKAKFKDAIPGANALDQGSRHQEGSLVCPSRSCTARIFLVRLWTQRGDLPDILGFVTVNSGQVATGALASPPRLPRYPVPILALGHLAVDRRYQGQGMGHDLLAFALRLANEFSERVGLYTVVVDAKRDSAARFYQQLSFTATLGDPLCLYVPVSQPIAASKP